MSVTAGQRGSIDTSDIPGPSGDPEAKSGTHGSGGTHGRSGTHEEREAREAEDAGSATGAKPAEGAKPRYPRKPPQRKLIAGSTRPPDKRVLRAGGKPFRRAIHDRVCTLVKVLKVVPPWAHVEDPVGCLSIMKAWHFQTVGWTRQSLDDTERAFIAAWASHDPEKARGSLPSAAGAALLRPTLQSLAGVRSADPKRLQYAARICAEIGWSIRGGAFHAGVPRPRRLPHRGQERGAPGPPQVGDAGVPPV